MNARKLGRRVFLGGVGASVLAAPFLRVARGKADPPVRFIGMFTGNGFVRQNDLRTIGTGTSFRFGSALASLEPFRAKIAVVEGLDMSVTYISPGGGHAAGTGGFLTGQPLQSCSVSSACFDGNGGSAGWADGVSIDQHIADTIGATTRRRSLELGVQLVDNGNRARIAYSGPGAPLPPIEDPFRVYSDLFAGLTPEMTTSTDADRILRQRRSILDFVKGDIGRLQTRLGTEEQAKLEAHLSAIRDVETRLSAATAPVSAGCSAPALGSRVDPASSANYEAIGRLQMDLLVAALRCDMTRVATLVWAGAVNGKTFRMPDGRTTEGHHSLSHEPAGTPKLDQLAFINKWYADRFAYLLNALDSTPDGTGTLLDNTVVVWGTDISKGIDHQRRDMQYIVAGGGGGRLRTGALVTHSGLAHNRLLVTLATACGVPTTSFGHPMFAGGGALPGMLV